MRHERFTNPRTGSWLALRGSVWGLMAGLIGSLCCIGPSAAILLGFGSSSLLFGFHVDGRWALAGGAVAIVIGCALALRRARSCGIRGRSRLPTLGWMLLSAGLAYGLFGVVIPRVAAQREAASAVAVVSVPAGQVATGVAPMLRQATLLVQKMDCPPCVSHLSALLSRKSFIKRFVVEGGNEQVVVVYDAGAADGKALLRLIPQSYGVVLQADTALPAVP